MADSNTTSSDRVQNYSSSRRKFFKQAAAASLAISGAGVFDPYKDSTQASIYANEIPWFRRITRWGQTNITEKDPPIYDISWWRNHWKRTGTQGVIINAGGIIAYYPTKIPFHYQAEYLQERDLFGELSRAAHEDGLWFLPVWIQTGLMRIYIKRIPTGSLLMLMENHIGQLIFTSHV